MRSNDVVAVSFAETLLREAGIASFVADQNMSILEGGIGIFPRRMLVHDDDFDRAAEVLRDNGIKLDP